MCAGFFDEALNTIMEGHAKGDFQGF